MSTTGVGLSVSLCTYNGERFLSEQLSSIAAQTLKPDEIVICDDHSTDGTVEIARKFAETAPFEVRIRVQPQNIGWHFNRPDSYTRCRGKLIAVCDQDDVWDPDKLETMTRALSARPECLLVFCDSRVADENLVERGYTSWQSNALTEQRQEKILAGKSLESLLPSTPVADATILFRMSLLEIAMPFPTHPWMPDEWLVILAAALGGCTLVARTLQVYRQHSTNLFGAAPTGFVERYKRARQSPKYFLQQENRFSVLLERLRSKGPAGIEHSIELIKKRMDFAAARRLMRERPLARPWLILRELLRGNYHSMGTGFRSVAMDLVL